MFAPFLALAAAAAFAASPNGPPAYPPTGSANPIGPPPHPQTGSTEHVRPANKALAREYQTKAKALQMEMAALQETDGGRLTAEHRAYLREKAGALLSAYRRDLQLAATGVNPDRTPKH